MATSEQRVYRRSLGLLELVCLGVGGTIGSGIFVVPGIAAGLAGVSSLAAWIVVAVSACAVAFALASIRPHADSRGAFVAVFADRFPAPFAAALVALYLLGSVLGVATIAAGLGQYLSYFGIGHALAAEVAIVGAFLAVNLAGIALSGRTENVLSAIKIAGLVAIVLVLAPHVRGARLAPASVAPLPTLLHVAIIVYWPFTGFEISAIPVAEAKDSAQVGRALLVVMVLVCAIYVALNVALLGAIDARELASSPAPIAYAVARIVPSAGPWIALLGIVTMLSALNAYVVGTSRVLQGAAERFAVAAPLARLSARGVPAAALALTCIASAALLFLSNRFAALASASVVATLVPYVAICWAAAQRGGTRAARGVAWLGAFVTAAMLALYFAL